MESDGCTDRNPNNHQTVTPVGNAWVLCRSKSYSGRIYYFNTLTGEAVWNLSNEEIGKAKKSTAKLPLQPGNFPEPQGPPGDHSSYESHPNITPQPTKTQYTPPKVYNKQVINNQFTRPPFSPLVASCQNCNPMNSVQGMGVRPNVWIQPPQIFLAAPPTSMTNQTTENLNQLNNFHQDFTVQNTSVSLSRRFTFVNKRGKNFSNRCHGIGKFVARNNNFSNFNTRKPFVPKRMLNQNAVSDLRNILSAKKPVNETFKQPEANNVSKIQEVSTPIIANQNQEAETPAFIESKPVEDDVHADDKWLKDYGIIEGAKLKLDVKVLKDLATGNADCECWYIVVDKNVLMNHFNFLNVLTTSDEQCKLMIVRDVMVELQAAARSDLTKDGARKVLRGLSQLFAAKLAVIAEYSFKPTEVKDGNGMINFCSMLQQQNEHVVLLSNESGIQKHSSKVPSFTIQSVKELLTAQKPEEIKIVSPVIERNIKITIPNDIASYEDVSIADDSSNVTLTQENVSKTICAASNTKEMNVQTDIVLPINTSKMVDAEVQTDPNSHFPRMNLQRDTVGVNTVELNIDETRYVDRETNVGSPHAHENNEEPKTREIRLKRSISNHTVRSNNDADKKHFKWHRKRRDGSVAFSDSASSLDDRTSRMSTTSLETNAHTRFGSMQNVICQPRSQSTQMYYDDVDGSETSSCVFMQRTGDNILIEETSTSDEISNSISNVDSDGIQVVNKCKEKTNNDEVQSKNVMFEITSKAMEQNLKMRSDEWLAEFIQIMEEVLTHVLRRKSEDIVKKMPPPWTLHEATECIKKIFQGDSDIIDAATKLSLIIHKMSDVKGNIIVDFKPNEFMELYSYGVYLVDSLQSMFEKCEDLQIAAESLAKLLKDIESPIEDGGHNDSFGDTTEVSVIMSQSSAEAPNQEIQSVISNSNKSNNSRKSQKERKELDNRSNKSSEKYNLRSNNKRKANEVHVETQSVKFIRNVNIHDDFFTSLHLQRKDEKANESTKNRSESLVELTKNDDQHKNPNEGKPAETGPSIIRNFSKCPEFEEKLKTQTREPLDMDMLDYSMGYNDYEYDDINETYSDGYEQYGDYGLEGMKEDVPERDFAEKSQVDDNNNDFKNLVTILMDEIRETTVNVHAFCNKTYEEMMSENMHGDRTKEIHDKAQKAKEHIQDICNSFRRIHERNSSETTDGSRSELKEAGILLNDKEALVYRDVIGTCIEQGDTLLESINTIIDAVKA